VTVSIRKLRIFVLISNRIEYWSNYSIRFEISNIRTSLVIIVSVWSGKCIGVVIIVSVWSGKCIRVAWRRRSDRELRIILGWWPKARRMPAASRQRWTTTRSISSAWCTDFTSWRRSESCVTSLLLLKVPPLCCCCLHTALSLHCSNSQFLVNLG